MIRTQLPDYVVAVLAVGLALLVKLLLNPLIEEESPFLLFFGAVMVGAWFGGLGPGLFATALASSDGRLFLPVANLPAASGRFRASPAPSAVRVGGVVYQRAGGYYAFREAAV
jgi:hypothetical protein